LVRPAEPYLQQAQTLVVVPDGALHYLPFEVLLTAPPPAAAEPGGFFVSYRAAPYLVRRYAVAYTSSASVLHPQLVPRALPQLSSPTLLAFAPFGGAEAHRLAQPLTTWIKTVFGHTREAEETVRAVVTSPLPASQQEVQTLGRLFHPDATVLLAHQATKGALQTQAPASRYIHIATHGLVNEVHPMHSGLMFADDEVLQTHEIFHLALHAELVTLSACETGLGALREGEGLIGFTRAFLYAGTSSVVASVWRVSDPSTAALMTVLYHGLRAGQPKAAALQQAKVAVMQQYPHPYFWAPFLLFGGWR
jgi:CHAT domain-containing protein